MERVSISFSEPGIGFGLCIDDIFVIAAGVQHTSIQPTHPAVQATLFRSIERNSFE
jgi:hypothetical protein